jgi:hypothetical protein
VAELLRRRDETSPADERYRIMMTLREKERYMRYAARRD